MKTFSIFKINIVASLFNLFANMILLFFFRNIIVAAITTFISYFIAFIYVYRLVREEWSVEFHPGTVLKALSAALVMGGVLFWIASGAKAGVSMGLLAGELVLGIVIYFGTLLALRTFTARELVFIKNMRLEIS